MHKFFAKTEYLGKKVIFLPQCHSTNNEAQRIVKSGDFQEGTVIISEFQTRGKGQRGNSWESEPGKNALYSVILKPEFLRVKDQFQLHMLTSLAIHDMLFPILGPNVQIKWPNDIYYKNRKISGILIENTLSRGKIDTSVIGIGINVNQGQFSAPNATSLYEITMQKFEVNEVIEQTIIALERRIANYSTKTHTPLKREYERKLFQLGDVGKYSDSEGDFLGTILGVDESGRLKIEKGGITQLYDFKEIEFL